MRLRGAAVFISVVAAATFNGSAAEPSWVGEYADKNFLNGQAVFELSIQQLGSAIQVPFDAGYNDGHGAAPEAVGHGKASKSGTLEFKWEDSFKNSGTGTVRRAGDDIIVSLKASRVADPRCLVFYRQNMRLKHVK